MVINIRVAASIKAAMELVKVKRRHSLTRIVCDAVEFQVMHPPTAPMPQEPRWGEVECQYITIELSDRALSLVSRAIVKDREQIEAAPSLAAPWLRWAVSRYLDYLRDTDLTAATDAS